jgi:hypothetical protein
MPVVKKHRWPKPPPDVIATGLRALAEAYGRKYPALHVVVHEAGRELPGARNLPGALPLQREPILDRGQPRPRLGRRNEDTRDE